MKKIICFVLAISLTATLCACNHVAEVSNTTQSSSSSSSSSQLSSSVSSEEEVPKEILNPLTGKSGFNKKAVGKRPVGIMINNIKQALPQSGISQADIVYEMPVEGGITRLFAVFADYNTVPKIGSVRSSRHNYLELAMPLDCLYIHFGGSTYAYKAIANYQIDSIDGMTASSYAFEQDKAIAAARGREHSWYTDAAHIKAAIKKMDRRTKLTAPAAPIFSFVDTKLSLPATVPAVSVTVPYSYYAVATFDYNKTAKQYEKGQFNAPHIDAATNKPVSVDNVFILTTTTSTISKKGHQEIDLDSGDGYYLNQGLSTPIHWAKKDEKSPFTFTDADGKELKVACGQSWICVVPKQNTITIQ